MFVPAMEQQHGAARRVGRRPVAIEQLHAVVRREGLLFGRAHGFPFAVRRYDFASASPRRTRLTMLTAISTATTGSNHASHAGSAPPRPTHSPSAPNTRARSLLPIGPS